MVISNKIGQLEYLTAEGISAPHCFTTRLGGVSKGHLDSLNIGTSRGDDRENVIENYRRIGDILGFRPEDLVLSRQTHSDIVQTVEEHHRGTGLFAPPFTECDALITRVPGIALVVFTADCTPILFWDKRTGAVGAAHAGWRGTVSAIAAKTVRAMQQQFGSDPADICCAVGPNIGACHFETDADVPDALKAAFGNEMDTYIRPAGEKYYVDLKAVNEWILRQAGVCSVDVSTECTMCSPNRFWSHRITGQARGSQGGIILCREVSA